MTEGILLREMMADPLLKSYSAIMLDEVHEKSAYTEILMGLMKKILKVKIRFSSYLLRIDVSKHFLEAW